jgi:tetratricopeptide (TPR) repeat protein
LGNLLIKFGIVAEADLERMLATASATNLPVGRVFVLNGLISELDLSNLIFCQSLLKENLIALEQAREAIDFARRKQVPLDQALTQIGWNPGGSESSTPLGELLVSADFISHNALNSALARQEKTGLPLGRVLVMSGVISETLLSAAVNAQILVRDGKVRRDQAVDALKEARRRQVTVETSLKEKGFYDMPKRTVPRLGELLTFSGMISDSELIHALEIGLLSQKPIGEVLMQTNLLTPAILDAALKTQKLLADSKIGLNQAREVLGHVKDGKSFEQAVNIVPAGETAETEATSLSLCRFLTLLGRVSESDITQAFEVAKNSTQFFSQMLQMGGVMDEQTLRKADQCRSLVQGRRLSLEHAAILFDYSSRMSLSIEEAMKELHWHDSREKRAPAPVGNLVKAPALPGQPQAQEQGAKNSGQIDLGMLRNKAVQLAGHGYLEEARQMWEELLQLLPKTYDARHCECLEGLAETYTLQQQYDKAMTYYQDAAKHRKQLYGSDSLSAAFAVMNLGKVSYFMGNFTEAESHAREYIRLVSLNKGAEHPDVACGYQNLATLLHMQSKLNAAEQMYKIAIRICTNALGDANPTTVRIVRNYASLLQQMQKVQEAHELDPLASPTISGNWRALDLAEEDRLFT